MISILMPSRGRPKKSLETYKKWQSMCTNQFILSLDEDDPSLNEYLSLYPSYFHRDKLKTNVAFDIMHLIVVNRNRSAVDAINNAAKVCYGEILIVVSDDTDSFDPWDMAIEKETKGKHDWVLKTQDGIQDWIITMPVMDRTYYNRFGYIYDPDFLHMFCDTWLTVQADISGRKLTSNLKFPHLNGSIQDDLRKRCDATWDQGEKTFIQKVRNTPVEDLNKITDRGMKNWIRNKTGIRV